MTGAGLNRLLCRVTAFTALLLYVAAACDDRPDVPGRRSLSQRVDSTDPHIERGAAIKVRGPGSGEPASDLAGPVRNPTSGFLLWQKTSPSDPFTAGEILLHVEGGALARLDPLTGKAIWRFAPVDSIVKPIVHRIPDGSGLLAVVDPFSSKKGRRSRIFRLDVSTGTVKSFTFLPKGFSAADLYTSRIGEVCVQLTKTCCGSAGTMVFSDDLLELPSPPNACEKPEASSRQPTARGISLPEDCNLIHDDPGALDVLFPRPFPSYGVALHEKVKRALVSRTHGTYLIDLEGCRLLCRLPFRARIVAMSGTVAVARVADEVMAFDLATEKTGPSCKESLTRIAGWLRVQAGYGRKVPLFQEPDWSSKPISHISAPTVYPYDAVSDSKRLGVPFYKLVTAPLIPHTPGKILWVWGGNVLLLKSFTSGLPRACPPEPPGDIPMMEEE